MNDIKFDWDDILVVPSKTSFIQSRKEVELNRLPLYVAPMDTVVDHRNAKLFWDKGFEVCLPRHIKYTDELDFCFFSYGLDDIKKKLDDTLNPIREDKVLIDIANGNMVELITLTKKFKSFHPTKTLMVGNVANPETYVILSQAGADIVRIGVGNGSGCLTTQQTGIGYPMASLVEECRELKDKYNLFSDILADGGFRKYSDVIKSLAVGSDGVMLGGILNKCLESCSPNYQKLYDNSFKEVSIDIALNNYNSKIPVFKYYRGMSTKEVQRDWGRTNLQTSEGITKYNMVDHTIDGWVENFIDYLKTNMSYCDKRTMEEFVGKVNYVLVTQNAFNRYSK
tara:strand:- start:8182 stop:9198 length:1017 start_codon:yes stop_codon:yes gene_type:complete